MYVETIEGDGREIILTFDDGDRLVFDNQEYLNKQKLEVAHPH